MKNINKLLVIFLLVTIVGLQHKSAFSQTKETENNIRENQEKCPHHENHDMMDNHDNHENHEMMSENSQPCKNHDMMDNHENHENHENHDFHEGHHEN